MPTYILLCKWTEKARSEAASLPARVADFSEFVAGEAGATSISTYATVGRYDEVWIIETPDEETIARLLFYIAARGFVTTETMRALSMDEIAQIL